MKYKCSFCSFQTDDIVACGKHYEMLHKTMLPKGMMGEQFAYYTRTGRKTGNCVVCKKPTKWNEKTHKYHRICSVRCARKYGEIKKLTNPKVQEEMLSHRKISGEYQWSSPDENGQKLKFTYTGSYELDFLKYMDQTKHWPVNDFMMPCPHLFSYTYEGQKRFYIPDAYIPSLDLVIEIKDGDPNNPKHHANHHPDIMRVNRAKEKLKKEAVNKSNHHYLVIYNKEYDGLERYLRTNDVRYLSEDVSDAVNTVFDAMLDYLDDPQKILMKIFEDWKEEVEDHKLKDFCQLSERLNGYVYDALKSDKFDELYNKLDPLKTMVTDLLKCGGKEVECVFSIMDSDSTIKANTHDPYVIYLPEYQEAKKTLMKWKQLSTKTFIGENLEVTFDEENDDTVRLILHYTEPEDED